MTLIADVITAIQDIVTGISGIREAPAEPPEELSVFPFAVCYPGTGEFEEKTAGCMVGEHIIRLEIHVARKYLRTDYLNVIDYVETIPLALLNNKTLNATVDINERIRYSFESLGWNGMETIGWRFEIACRTRTALT